MKKNLTIKDIAALAGVSVSTVSRVLNNSPFVSDKRRGLIKEIIKKYNFSPNMLARGMILKKTRTLAVIVSDITNPYFITLVAQLEKEALRRDYRILLFDTQSANRHDHQDPVLLEKNIFNIIIESHIDGVIMLGGYVDYMKLSSDYLESLQNLINHTQLLLVGRPLSEIQAPFIARDQQAGTRLITRHLIGLGYQSIGFIGGSANVYMTIQRLETFRETLLEAGLVVEESSIILNNFYAENGAQAVRTLLKTANRPQALIAINDQVAMGAIRALTDQGIKVPDQIAVASCEYFTGSEYFCPRITTIDHQSEELGACVINTMLALLQNEDLPPQQPIAAVLRQGEST